MTVPPKKIILEELPQATSPIPCPKSIGILLINPNATKEMTLNCLSALVSANAIAPDVTVYGYTAPKPSPSTIEGNLDAVLSAAAVFRDIIPNLFFSSDSQTQCKIHAALVACFSDHPLVNALREELEIPVIGIFEAGLYAARMLGGRFGVVATVHRSQIKNANGVQSFGLDKFCAGVVATNTPVADFHKSTPKANGSLNAVKENKPSTSPVMERMALAAEKLVTEKDADTIVLGCAGMTSLKSVVQAAVGNEVQVVDGVLAGVNFLTGLIRMGGKTAKAGLYASSRDARESRGQTYI